MTSGCAINSLIGNQVERQTARRAGRKCAEMGAWCRSLMSARYLKHMFACLCFGHVELLDRRPVFDPSHSCCGAKAVMCRFTVEGYANFHVAASMQVCLYASMAGVVAHEHNLVDGLFAILKEDDNLRGEAVFLDEQGSQSGEGMFRAYFHVLDIRMAFELIKDVCCFHELIS
jgi:hypothetical protein